MRTRSAATAVAVLAVLAGPQSAAAEAPRGADSTLRDSVSRYTLPPIVVTASRLPAAPGDLGFATWSLRRENLAAEPTPYAAQALTFAPGAAIEEGAGPGGPAVLRLRGGEEPFTQVLFDGVPINISGGFLDLQGLTLTNVDRVEIARGPLSALWGSAAMSGAVQFITRVGQIGPPRFELQAEGGRASKYGAQAHSQLAVSGGGEHLLYSGGLGYTYHRGVYDLPNDLTTADASLRVDATLSKRWSLTATARHMDIEARLPVRDPGATRVPLDPNQNDARTRTLAALSATWSARPTWHHRLTARVLRDDFVYRDQRDGITDSNSYPFFVFDANLRFQTTLLRTAVEYMASHALSRPPASPLDVSYGAEWQWEDQRVDQSGDYGTSQTELDSANGALFAELQGRLGPRLSVLTGARVEKIEGLPPELLPRGGIVFVLVPERLALRAAAGRAFKAPNVDQQFLENPFTVPNPDLKPESSVSWEVGASATAPGRRLTLGVGYFDQRFDGLIRTVPHDVQPKQTNRNLGHTRSAGVEIELERAWSERCRSGVNLAWIDTEVLDNAGLSPVDYPLGSALTAVPQVAGNVYVEAGFLRSISALLRATLVGKRTVFSERFTGQRITLAPYALLGLVVQWHATRTVGMYARVENLLDEGYLTAFDRPGVTRSAAFGLRLTP